jgi:hypothetical protein
LPSTSADSSASASRAPEATAVASTFSDRVMNVAFLATKSVSEFTSTITPTSSSPSPAVTTSAATRPSEAERPSRLETPFRPLTRMISSALSASPPASSSAFLTSIMPAPVFSRSALMSAME